MNGHRWEFLTNEYLDAIRAEGLTGEFSNENSGISKIILWDEVERVSNDAAILAGDLKIN
jgi:hypothetical protein